MNDRTGSFPHILESLFCMCMCVCLFLPNRNQHKSAICIHMSSQLLNLPPTSFRTVQFSLVQSLSHVQLFETPWTAARQASLSITKSWSLLKLMSIKLVMPSNHLILCRPFLLLPSIFPSIRIFSNESVLHIRWPKYLSFSFRMGSF